MRLLVVAGIVLLLLTAGAVNAADVCESELKGGDACSSKAVLGGASVAGFSVSSEGTTRRFIGYTGTGGSCIYGPGSHTVNVLVSDINVSAIESATLTVMAYDCDNPTTGCDGRPEIDTVYFNGEYTGILTGATDQWSTVSFDVDPSKILNGSNVVKVYIDTTGTGCWCLGVDWAELAVKIDDVDLKVNSSDLVLYRDWSSGYHMDATVHNTGSVEAEDVDVRVVKTYLGGVMDEREYNVGTIPAGGSKTIRYDFVAVDLGNYQLRVTADPDNAIDETDENNNVGETHRVYGVVKDGAGTPLENIVVSLDQQSSPYTSKFKTVTDENGNYAIILNFAGIVEGKQTQVNSTVEYSPDRDPAQLKLQVFDDPEWGEDFNPAANAKAYSKGEALGALNKERDYQKDITYPNHNALVAYKTLVKGYKYAKNKNIAVRETVKVEVNNNDACECTSPLNATHNRCIQTSCALLPIMTMWHTRSDKVDSMNHEYGHLASDSNGVNNQYNPVEENWANYFSCKSRETTVYDFWGTAIDVTNLEDTDGDRDAGGQNFAEDLWNFQLAGIYWQLAENSVIASLKTSGLNTPQQFYNAYKTTVGANTSRSKEIKRIFRDHGINAQAWAPAGYNIGLLQFEAESTGIQAGQYLTGAYAHGVVDGNGDGVYEDLNVYVTVNITSTGAYYLLGFISPALGGDACFASNYTNVSAGIRNVTLSFSGECIFKNRLDGVYMLSNVAFENGSFVELDSASQPYNTSSYNHTQFSSPVIFYTGTHSDIGLNTDGDPAYEFLKVTVEMNVSTSGNFTVQGVLLDGNGNPIFSRNHHFSQAEAQLPTAPGVINVSLNFTGTQIRASQANGPYTVQLYVYNGSNYELLAYSYSTGFNTSAYNASDFEGSGTGFVGTPTESAVDTDNNTFYNQIQVNATLNISADGTYVVSAHLYDGSGVTITSTANATNLSAGTNQMTLALDGRDIRGKAVNGPYNITCRLYSGQNLVSSATRSTAAYAYASFDAYGEDYFTIAYADHGTDAGGDGKYDYLTLDMNASTKLNGTYATYRFLASLYDASGTFVTQSDVNASLNNQSKSVQLNFTGEHVWARKKVNGTYNVTLEIYRYASNGTLVAELKNAYTTSAYNYTQFESKPAEFGGTYSDAGVDTEGDGLYNFLRVSVGVNVSENGTYSLTGYLYDVNGSYIVSEENETELVSGAKTVWLYFDGYEVYNHGVNGSYSLKNIVLYKNGSQADYKETAYNTTSYAYTSFQRSQVALTGNYSSYGVDSNNNSKYDYLIVDAGVNVSNTGTYAINARLVDSTGREIVWTSNESYLYKNQTNSMQLRFSGRSIYGGLTNGPYYLNDLHIYNTGATTQSIRVSSAYTISGFNYTDFEQSGVIEGFVRNTSGSPVQYTIVSYSGDSDVANGTGYYRLMIPSTGQYTITAAPPYGSDYVDNATNVTASVGNITSRNITLPNQAILYVNVVNESGTPINDSSVSLSGASSGSNTTVNGSCQLGRLKGGQYTVTVTPPSGPNLLSNATTFNLSYGERRTLNITLLTGGIVEGNVTRYDGTPVYSAYVYLYGGPSSGSGYTNQSGTFYLQRLQSGTYNLSVTAPSGSNLKSNSTLVNVTRGMPNVVNMPLAPIPEIYVNANTTLNGSTYNLDDEDGDGGIIINASNVVLDCNGSIINGTRTGYGVYIYNKNNVTVKNCFILNYDKALYVYYGSGNTVINNILANNTDYGIGLYYANNNTIMSNTISNNTDYGVYVSSSDYLTITENRINNNPYGIYIYYADGNNISSNNITNSTQYGIYMYYSTYNTLSGNALQQNIVNFWIYGGGGSGYISYYNHSIASSNTINGQPLYYYFNQSAATVENKNAGQIALAYSNEMTVRNNNITSGDGIILYNSNRNNLQNNFVFMSLYGAYFDYYSVNNTLTSNTFCSNSQYDIYASTDSSGTGSGNSCDYVSYYWNDNGTTDCTSRCGAQFTTTTTTTTTSTSSTSTSSTTSTTSTTTTIFSVVINEFMASPPGADDAPKPNGEWVELYNNGTLQQNLASWYLTENGGTLNITSSRTDTGNTLIAPQAFLLVYRDGATTFDLSDTTDNITLWTAGSLLMDSVAYNVTQLNASWSSLPENTSVGRSLDGSGVWTTFNASTAGRSNLGSQTTQHALVSGWNLISLALTV